MTHSRTLQRFETLLLSIPMHFLQMVLLSFPSASPYTHNLTGYSVPVLGSLATPLNLTSPSVNPDTPNSPAQLQEWKQLSDLGSWAETCRQPEAVAVCARSPPFGPLREGEGGGGKGSISRADTQEHPSFDAQL